MNVFINTIQFVGVHVLVKRQSGDIKMNPGAKLIHCHSFSICHWNSNSLTAHNHLKVSLLWAPGAINKFDVIFLSETYLYFLTYLMMEILIFLVIT